MKRSAIQVNSTTLAITLPKKWTISQGILKGHELTVTQNNDELIVAANSKKAIRKVNIDIDNNESLQVILGSAYRAGYDYITLNFNEDISLGKIQKILEFFVGLDIESFDPKKVTVTMIATPENKDIEFFTNKIFLSTQVMFEQIHSAFLGKKFLFSDLVQMWENNIRAKDYVMRAMNTGLISKDHLGDHYTFVHVIEKISGSLWHIGQYLDNHKVVSCKSLQNLFLETSELYRLLAQMVKKKEFSAGQKTILDRTKVEEDWFNGDKLAAHFSRCDPVILSLIVGIRMMIVSATTRYMSVLSDFNQK